MYERILLPIDRGVDSNRIAACEACQLGDQFGSTIHLLFVDLDADDGSDEREHGNQKNVEAVTKTREFIRGSEYDVDLKEVRRYGNASERICEYANENEVDLIVMATHGRSGLSRLAVGSVTENTLRDAPCPVLGMNTNYQPDTPTP
jgi:nucleotide-binding universal stress UspA family protein